MTEQGSGKESGEKTREKQGRMPGAEGERFPEVTKAAIAYKEARDARMAMEVTERTERDRLTQRMLKRGISTYVFEDEELEAYIPETTEPQAKVRTVKTED